MVRSPLQLSALHQELAKPIINGILDIFKEASVSLPANDMYYYHFDINEKTERNSFEEKSANYKVCVRTNLGVHTSCVLLLLLSIVHNGYYSFFETSPQLVNPILWINWLDDFVERDQKVCGYWTKTIEIPQLIKSNAEIYTIDNFWDVIHSYDK